MDKGVDKWVTTSIDRVVNGIMCAANPKCRDCNFVCAKWLGEGYNPDEQVKIIRDVLDRWDKSEARRRCK